MSLGRSGPEGVRALPGCSISISIASVTPAPYSETGPRCQCKRQPCTLHYRRSPKGYNGADRDRTDGLLNVNQEVLWAVLPIRSGFAGFWVVIRSRHETRIWS